MDVKSVAAKTAVASVALLSGAGVAAVPLVVSTVTTPAVASAHPYGERVWVDHNAAMQACRQDRPVWDARFGGRYQDVWFGFDGNNNIQCYGRHWSGGIECWGFPWWRYTTINDRDHHWRDDCGGCTHYRY